MNPLSNDELISAYLDGELSGEEQQRAEQLLAESAESRQLLEELRSLRSGMESLPRHRLEGDFASRVMDRAERAMVTGEFAEENIADGQAATVEQKTLDSDAAVVLPTEADLPRRRGSRTLAWSAAGIAAAVVAMLFIFPPQDYLALQESSRDADGVTRESAASAGKEGAEDVTFETEGAAEPSVEAASPADFAARADLDAPDDPAAAQTKSASPSQNEASGDTAYGFTESEEPHPFQDAPAAGPAARHQATTDPLVSESAKDPTRQLQDRPREQVATKSVPSDPHTLPTTEPPTDSATDKFANANPPPRVSPQSAPKRSSALKYQDQHYDAVAVIETPPIGGLGSPGENLKERLAPIWSKHNLVAMVVAAPTDATRRSAVGKREGREIDSPEASAGEAGQRKAAGADQGKAQGPRPGQQPGQGKGQGQSQGSATGKLDGRSEREEKGAAPRSKQTEKAAHEVKEKEGQESDRAASDAAGELKIRDDDRVYLVEGTETQVRAALAELANQSGQYGFDYLASGQEESELAPQERRGRDLELGKKRLSGKQPPAESARPDADPEPAAEGEEDDSDRDASNGPEEDKLPVDELPLFDDATESAEAGDSLPAEEAKQDEDAEDLESSSEEPAATRRRDSEEERIRVMIVFRAGTSSLADTPAATSQEAPKPAQQSETESQAAEDLDE